MAYTKLIVRNGNVWSFNCMYLWNVLTNHISNIYVKKRFGIKKNKSRMVDMP